jgi:hypothetical protein
MDQNRERRGSRGSREAEKGQYRGPRVGMTGTAEDQKVTESAEQGRRESRGNWTWTTEYAESQSS